MKPIRISQLLSVCIIAVLASPLMAQNRGGTGSGLGGGMGGGFGLGNSGQTGGSGGGQGIGQSNTGGGFGSGFTFDPGFGTDFGVTGNNGGMSRTGSMGLGMGGMGGMGMNGMGLGMGMGMGMGGFGMGRNGMGMFGMQQQQQQQNKLRPTVRLGFEVARPSVQQRVQQVQTTLSRLPQPDRFQGVSLQMEGSKAIVSGQLKDPNDAELLRQLLLLEPGVYEVDIQQLASASESSSSDSAIRALPEAVPSREVTPSRN